ncbi:MAG: sulfite exporter TauE/SafE family protein [Cyanobacteria bacterium P01_D01_bin.36]
MDNILWIGSIIGLAAVVQTLAGFGFALVAIALLSLVNLPLDVARPLVLMMALLSSLSLVMGYRKSLDWRAIAPLLLSALAMIPVGLISINYLSEQITLRALGSFIILYVAYDILKTRTKLLASSGQSSHLWAYVFGGLSGFLTGALTIPGPPLAMYANAQSWPAQKMKANVPIILATVQFSTLAGHVYQGNLTADVGKLALYSLPFFVMGMVVSAQLSSRIDEKRFKQIVLILLSFIGFKLFL